MIKTIVICGAGTMGRGIALTTVLNGFKTILFDVQQEILNQAKEYIEQQLSKIKTADSSEISGENIQYTNTLNDCRGDLIIEAIVENANVKLNLFKELSGLNASAIIVSNTSSLSIDELAADLPDPARFAGMHFFNPAHKMKLVELIAGKLTSKDTMSQLNEVSKALHKIAVECIDAPGFIVNRVARHYYLEALFMLEKEKINTETIDTLLESTGFKMGPFRLMDLIGNDINLTVSTGVYEALGKPARLKPSAIQQEKVRTGKLGRKSGEGYYIYK